MIAIKLHHLLSNYIYHNGTFIPFDFFLESPYAKAYNKISFLLAQHKEKTLISVFESRYD